MRTTISIPDEFAKKIKSSLGKKGFNTLNEYILNLIRVDYEQNIPVKQRRTTEEVKIQEESNTAEEWPSHKFGKPLSGKKASCPLCYETCPVEFSTEHYQKKHGDI